ncbi:unnamed protein product [Polarella glacialis]|uniref:Uncharacterized protein n=1 Tax=Polarella glacialis TaxID=89957 RepID=A0A813HAJ4_POLGL|nr:unnamed protein product [Polarella glacialis]
MLIQVEFLNAVFVRSDLVPLVDYGFLAAGLGDEDRWLLGYFCHPLRSVWRHSHAVQDRRFRQFDSAVLADPKISLREKLLLARGAASAALDPPGTEFFLDPAASRSGPEAESQEL